MAYVEDSETYLQQQSDLVRSGEYWNCLAAAQELSARLLEEKRHPWIARLRKTEVLGGSSVHSPLIPRGLGVALAWTTHYVCCCDGMAYDPVAGRPIELEAYSLEVFGQQISPEVFVSSAELPAYLTRNRMHQGPRNSEIELE